MSAARGEFEDPTVRLGDLAHARSGDKGDRANIGVVAFTRSGFEWLHDHLTEGCVGRFLEPLGGGSVTRHVLANLNAFNFVIEHALAGGASRSLRLDSQGKALASALLEMRIPRPTTETAPSAEQSCFGDATMSHDLVLRERHGPVVCLLLNRPEKRNALSRALVAELADCLSALRSDREVHAVVLRGAGRVFCAGMDLQEAEAALRSPEAERAAVIEMRAFADLIDELHGHPKPTIAALEGDTLAGGAGLALACDFVVAAEGVRIGYPEVKRGLVAATVMHDLVRQVGERRARALLLSGEPIEAEEARSWGLINRVVPAERCWDEALALARSLARCAPEALATTKRQLDEVTRRPPDLHGAAAVSAAVRVSAEAAEGFRAFREKRPPSWTADSARSREG